MLDTADDCIRCPCVVKLHERWGNRVLSVNVYTAEVAVKSDQTNHSHFMIFNISNILIESLYRLLLMQPFVKIHYSY